MLEDGINPDREIGTGDLSDREQDSKLSPAEEEDESLVPGTIDPPDNG